MDSPQPRITILNKLYTIIAIKLNDWENHRTDNEYENALIFKLFVFKCAPQLNPSPVALVLSLDTSTIPIQPLQLNPSSVVVNSYNTLFYLAFIHPLYDSTPTDEILSNVQSSLGYLFLSLYVLVEDGFEL